MISNGGPLSSENLADAIAHVALGTERPSVKDEGIPAELIVRLSGDFELKGIGLGCKVFGRQGKLLVQATGQRDFRILWQGAEEFRAEFDTDLRVAFGDDGEFLVLPPGGSMI